MRWGGEKQSFGSTLVTVFILAGLPVWPEIMAIAIVVVIIAVAWNDNFTGPLSLFKYRLQDEPHFGWRTMHHLFFSAILLVLHCEPSFEVLTEHGRCRMTPNYTTLQIESMCDSLANGVWWVMSCTGDWLQVDGLPEGLGVAEWTKHLEGILHSNSHARTNTICLVINEEHAPRRFVP